MANTLVDFSNELADAVERGGQAVVAVKEEGRSGVSGTVWRDNLVVTAEHTIRGREEVTITLPSGETASAAVVGGDPSTDIAVLKASGGAPVLPEFADSSRLRAGNVVLALGRRENGLSASYGIVSAVAGSWRTWRGGKIDQWLRLDLNPYPGFSGGPLVDSVGRVLGINTSGPRHSVLTIPNTTVDRVVNQLLSKGRITRGYLGIGGQPVAISSAIRQKLKINENRGLLLITVANEGPADKAGLLVGDIVLSIGDSSVAESADLLAVLEADSIGKTLPIHVLRGGSPLALQVTVGERESES
jgi:S1-C subfamily serine protease